MDDAAIRRRETPAQTPKGCREAGDYHETVALRALSISVDGENTHAKRENTR